MAKTAAERAKAYRDKKRDGKCNEIVTNRHDTGISTVTVCRTCGGPIQHPKIVKCLKCSTGTPAPKPGHEEFLKQVQYPVVPVVPGLPPELVTVLEEGRCTKDMVIP